VAEQKKKANKWLLGCGIGCGAVLLIVIALIVGTSIWMRGMVKGFEEATDTREVIEQRFGDPGDFTPAPDGAVPADRMEIFLAVRDASAAARARIDQAFSSIPMSEEQIRELESQSFWQRMGSGLKIGKDAMGLGPGMGELFRSRNQALIDGDMGLGEYTYIYVLAYYGLLGHHFDDGPGSDVDDSRVNVQIGGQVLGRRVHENLRDMLGHQLDGLPADADPIWRSAIEAEIAAMKRGRDHFPWKGGLPQAIRDSIEPYRERLAASWSAAANPFELARNRKRGAFSYTTD
jgi:hypothetical protein